VVKILNPTILIEQIDEISTDVFSWVDNSLKQLTLSNVNGGGGTSTGI
jgi:hypothetical protein